MRGDLGGLGALGNPEELWSALKTTILDVAGGCLLTHHRAKKNFVSQWTLDNIDQSHRARLNGRAELFRELRHKTGRAIDKKAYERGICEGEEHHLWSGDSRPAYRGIRAFHSSKPVPRCTAVGIEGGGLLREESKVKARWAGYFEWLYHADPPPVDLDVRCVTIPIADPQSTVIHLCLGKHRVWRTGLNGVKLLGFVASMLNFARLEMLDSCRCMQFCALPGTQASSELNGRRALLSLSGKGLVSAL